MSFVFKFLDIIKKNLLFSLLKHKHVKKVVIYRIRPDIKLKKIRIRFRPDSKSKKRSGSGSGRIPAEIWPDPDPVSSENLVFRDQLFKILYS